MKLTLTVLLVFSMAACTSNKILRENVATCYLNENEICGNHYITAERNTPNYTLSFIEIDDQGHLHDRNQMFNVLQHIKEKGENQEIVLFVHGWHHGAGLECRLVNRVGHAHSKKAFKKTINVCDREDRDIREFRKLLQKKAKTTTNQVTGIYIGWRGESIEIPIINIATFIGRKDTSIDVGQGALKEVLIRLEQLAKAKKSSLVTLGHSFGGSALFSALNSIIHERMVTGKEGRYGDMVVLLNPAIENIQVAPLYFTQEEMGDSFNSNKPSIVVLMSEADIATGIAFQAARLVSAAVSENQNPITRSDRNNQVHEYSQFEMDVKALGHYEPFITHTLKPSSKVKEKLKEFDLCYDSSTLENISSPKEGHTIKFKKSEVTLKHVRNSPAQSPIWIVKVDGKLVPSHNEIWSDHVTCFISELALGTKTNKTAVVTQP